MASASSRFGWWVALVLTGRLFAGFHSAVDPVPRSEASWQERHKLLNQRASEAAEKAQVIFIGDSITQGWEGAGKEVWARFYGHRNAVNLGIGGDRTQHVLWRLANGNLEALRPKAAVVMIGTNNSNGEDNTPEQIADGVGAIVRSLRDRLPQTKILLVAIFPRSENPTAQRGKVLMVNQIIRRLADDRDVFWVDFGHRFLNDAGLIPRDLMPDYLHLSPEGYAIWADALEDTLSRVIGDERVKPMAASSGSSLTSEWLWTIRGPDGNPVEGVLVLEQQGDRVNGRFARGDDRWLPIENGKVAGSEFSWTVTRDRRDGGTMTYSMTGRLEGDRIAGKAKTEMNGSPIEVDWSAKRR